MTTQTGILEALAMTEGYPQPRRSLLSDVCRLLGKEVSLTDLKAALGYLEAKRQVVVVTEPDDGGGVETIEIRTLCMITSYGKARLRGGQ
jgi:hypothetical protein